MGSARGGALEWAGLRERAESEAEPGTKAQASDPTPERVAPALLATVALDFLSVAEPRFRDWNPDVRVALEHGVSIHYDSARNRVVSEGCRAMEGGGFDLYGSGGESGGGDGGSTDSGAGSAGGDHGGNGFAAQRGPIPA